MCQCLVKPLYTRRDRQVKLIMLENTIYEAVLIANCAICICICILLFLGACCENIQVHSSDPNFSHRWSDLICSLFTFSCPSRNPIKSFHCSYIPHIPKKLFFFNFTRNASSFPVLKSPSPPDPLFWCCLSMSLLTQKVATIATLLLLKRPPKKWSKSPLTQKCENMYINWNTLATGMVQFCCQYQCSKSEKAAERIPNLFFKRIKTTIWSKKTRGHDMEGDT